MKRTSLIVITVLFLIALAGAYYVYTQTFGQFWTTERTIHAQLGNQAKTVRIDIDPEAQYPHSMDLHMKGKINGKGIISYGWADTAMYMIDTVQNDFTLEYSADWYEDVCLITYQPLSATDGSILIDCSIYSSKK